MAIFDVFKKGKEKERFEKKQKVKTDSEKKDNEKIEKKTGASKKASVSDKPKSGSVPKNLSTPHITEKAASLGEEGVYVFKVGRNANKIIIKQEIKKAYGVSPKKVNITNSPSKKRFIRGRRGVKPGFKKAVVYLNKGDKIEV
ncbi:MAG: 50S ribosomal protein L23 [bacterium]|nr:50S ribosomal protein L23 [bacterium]